MNTTSAQGHVPKWEWSFAGSAGMWELREVYEDGTWPRSIASLSAPPCMPITDEMQLLASAPTLLSDNAALTAEVARLREALDKIANFTRDITGGPVMVAVARAALEGAK